MAKAKARRRVRDTWKEKSWYTIKTPVNFEISQNNTSNSGLKLIMLQVMLQTQNSLATKPLLIM